MSHYIEILPKASKKMRQQGSLKPWRIELAADLQKRLPLNLPLSFPHPFVFMCHQWFLKYDFEHFGFE